MACRTNKLNQIFVIYFYCLLILYSENRKKNGLKLEKVCNARMTKKGSKTNGGDERQRAECRKSTTSEI